jgi:outer membrane receptor protein involved in Fe transport
MRVLRFVLAAALVAAFCPEALAQRITAQLEGAISDQQGAALPGASVTLRNQSTGFERTLTTPANGRYLFRGLPVEGLYTVTVELQGFNSMAHREIKLEPNQARVVNFSMTVGGVTETVEVVGEAPAIDTVNSTVQQTVTEELVRSLPLFGRNFLHLAALSAGFSGNKSFPNNNGQYYFSNNVLVDGASHFSKWRSAARTFHAGYGLESVKEVQVLNNKFSAEFGESMSTVTSAVTKSGTNDVSGSVFLFAQDDALNAVPVFAKEAPPISFQQFGFTLGGPIQKDKTHFFASYEGRRQRSFNIITSPAAPGETAPNDEDEHLLFLKIDHQAGQRHLLSARWNGQFFDWVSGGGGLTLPSAGYDYANDVQTFLLSDTFQVSDRVLNETRLQFAHYVDRRTDVTDAPYVVRSGYSTEGGFYGPPGFGADPEDTWELSNTLSYWAQNHSFKFGVGAKRVTAVNPQLFFGRGFYFYGGAPDQFPDPILFQQAIAIEPGSEIARPRAFQAFVFAQDDWRLGPKLVLNLGLRYDIEDISNIDNYNAPTDKNNVQPRLGFTFDPSGSGKTAIRGGAGLYTQQQLFYHLNRAQLNGPGGPVTITLLPGQPGFPTYPNALPSIPPGTVLPPRDIREVADDLKNPYSIQATLGIQHEFHPGLVLSADFVHLHGKDLYGSLDVNPPASIPAGQARTVAEADATRPITPGPDGFRNIIRLTNKGENWYNAVQIKARGRVDRISYMLSYTLSSLDQQLEPWNPPVDSALPVDQQRARGPSDTPHNLVGGLTWTLPGDGALTGGWTVSSIFNVISGLPYTAIFGDDRTGTTLNRSVVGGGPRPGELYGERNDTFYNLDFTIGKVTNLGGHKQLEIRAEMFNVFNVTQYTSRQNVVGSANFGEPIGAAEKRRIQLAALFRF